MRVNCCREEALRPLPLLVSSQLSKRSDLKFGKTVVKVWCQLAAARLNIRCFVTEANSFLDF